MAHKSILVAVCVDEAGKAHDCQHNKKHRLERGNRRLKVRKDRSDEHFCVECALAIIERDIEKLRMLAKQLRREVPLQQ